MEEFNNPQKEKRKFEEIENEIDENEDSTTKKYKYVEELGKNAKIEFKLKNEFEECNSFYSDEL